MKFLFLAAALLALPQRGPDPNTIPEADLVYCGNRAELYRKHHVREIRVEEQQFLRDFRQTPTRLIIRQDLDANGRLRREDTSEDRPYLSRRRDFEYSAAGALVAQTEFQRAETRADTVQAPPSWLPVLHTRTVAEPGEPAGATRFHIETGLWQPVDRVRSWTRHDTTYAETRTVPNGRLTLRTRSYYTGPGKNTLRYDVLPFEATGAGEPQFQYYRFEHNSPVESGTVSYEKAVETYLQSRSAAGRTDRHALYAALDHVSRQSAGTNEPSGTATYNPHNQLLTMDMYDVLTAYRRDAQGRALTRSLSRKGHGPARITTYTYRPDGLLASETVTKDNSPPLEVRNYRYEFF